MATGIGRPHLSVVVPAYNEEARIGETLPRIDAYLRQRQIDAEILVVDDGSTDATAERASAFLQGRRGRLLRDAENQGKGHAIRHGALSAEGRWVLVADAALSTPIEEHARLAESARDHDLDMAFGSRALADSRVEFRRGAARRAIGGGFDRLLRRLTGLPFRDVRCGFRLMDRERLRPLLGRMVASFAFDVELLFLCHRFELRVREVPVTWREDPRPPSRLFTDPPRILWDVLKIRWNFRQGLYHPRGAD